MSCRRPDFAASVDVEGLDFTTDLKITCAACGVPMPLAVAGFELRTPPPKGGKQ